MLIEQRLPWWTWLVPVVVCHLGTQAALYFQFAPGVSISYWPIPFALVLSMWWGPRALLGLYLNAVLSAGWGGWIATMLDGLAVAVPLLLFFTPHLERRGLTRTAGAQPIALVPRER